MFIDPLSPGVLKIVIEMSVGKIFPVMVAVVITARGGGFSVPGPHNLTGEINRSLLQSLYFWIRIFHIINCKFTDRKA